MSVRSWVTIDKIESIYDATIRDSTSSPYATRGGGHTRIEYEDMMQSGHAGRIKKWIKQNETDVWSPYLKHDIEKQSGGTRTILMPSFNVQLASSLYRRYYSNRLETPTCFYGLSQEAFDGATGVHAAVRRARDIQSQAWGIKVDIVDFFGSISDDLLEQSIHNDFCQDDVSLISRFMHLPVTTQDGDTFDSTFDAYGLPQGNPLSPILARRSICDFPSCLDVPLSGVFVYVDDVLVLRPTRAQAMETWQQIQTYFQDRGLDIEPSDPDDAIIPPNQSIRFLGHTIRGSSEPAGDDMSADQGQNPDHGPSDPGQGAGQGQDGQQQKPDGKVRALHPPRESGREARQASQQAALPMHKGDTTPRQEGRIPEATTTASPDPKGNSKGNKGKGTARRGRTTGTADPCGQDDPLREIESKSSPRGEESMNLFPPTVMQYWISEYVKEIDKKENERALIQWIKASLSVASFGREVQEIGFAKINQRDLHASTKWDFVAPGTLKEYYGNIEYPTQSKDQWSPDVFLLPIPYPSPDKSVQDGRLKAIRALTCRARKGLRPGGVLLGIAGSQDLSAHLAFETAPTDDLRPVGRHVLDLDSFAPDLHIRMWRREGGGTSSSTLGHLQTPWLRIERLSESRYSVHTSYDDTIMTHGHDLLQGRLPRSLASLYDVVGEAVEKAVERGARHLALIHHGDFQKEFFVREEGEGDVWTPRKSDLVEPIERLRNVLGEMSKVNFYRESEGGIEWDKGVTLDID